MSLTPSQLRATERLFQGVQECFWAGMTPKEIKDATGVCVQNALDDAKREALNVFKDK
jgi:hypothetical protein